MDNKYKQMAEELQAFYRSVSEKFRAYKSQFELGTGFGQNVRLSNLIMMVFYKYEAIIKDHEWAYVDVTSLDRYSNYYDGARDIMDEFLDSYDCDDFMEYMGNYDSKRSEILLNMEISQRERYQSGLERMAFSVSELLTCINDYQ